MKYLKLFEESTQKINIEKYRKKWIIDCLNDIESNSDEEIARYSHDRFVSEYLYEQNMRRRSFKQNLVEYLMGLPFMFPFNYNEILNMNYLFELGVDEENLDNYWEIVADLVIEFWNEYDLKIEY